MTLTSTFYFVPVLFYFVPVELFHVYLHTRRLHRPPTHAVDANVAEPDACGLCASSGAAKGGTDTRALYARPLAKGALPGVIQAADDPYDVGA